MELYDVLALGELLIDFTESQASDELRFTANPGGAPSNVLAMLSKLGKKTAFIGKLGADFFGTHLVEAIAKVGIATDGVVRDSSVNTTLAFVKTEADGDRDFVFFRQPGADTMLRPDELRLDLIEACRIFHFGSLSLTDEPARSATVAAVEAARRFGKLISFDPNLRPPLWREETTAREQMDWGCRHCDILKLAEDEALFITGERDLESALERIRRDYARVKIIFLTKGKAGSEVFYQDLHLTAETYLELPTIDTTGAGDTFLGACLAKLLDYGLEQLDEALLLEILRFANAASSLITCKRGALAVMPSEAEIKQLMNG